MDTDGEVSGSVGCEGVNDFYGAGERNDDGSWGAKTRASSSSGDADSPDELLVPSPYRLRPRLIVSLMRLPLGRLPRAGDCEMTRPSLILLE